MGLIDEIWWLVSFPNVNFSSYILGEIFQLFMGLTVSAGENLIRLKSSEFKNLDSEEQNGDPRITRDS